MHQLFAQAEQTLRWTCLALPPWRTVLWGQECSRAYPAGCKYNLEQKDAKSTKSGRRDLSGESVKTDHGLSFILMAAENLEDTKTQLAVALAQGVAVIAWARARDVRQPTV